MGGSGLMVGTTGGGGVGGAFSGVEQPATSASAVTDASSKKRRTTGRNGTPKSFAHCPDRTNSSQSPAFLTSPQGKSEERREGNVCVRTFRSRCSRLHEKNKLRQTPTEKQK